MASNENTSDAERALEVSRIYPYDYYDDTPQMNRLVKDWAHKAARGVIYDLQNRRGIKHQFNNIDEEIRFQIVDALADIIRTAARRERELI